MDKNKGVFGYVPSIIDGTEAMFQSDTTLEVPEKYTFIPYMPPVIDQGDKPICVTCSVSAHLDWNLNMDRNGEKKNHGVNLGEIYASKTNMGDGMTFKDALKFLRKKGVHSDVGVLKVEKYAMVSSPDILKHALVLNGPCVGALPVYNNNSDEFWKDKGDFLGGHAISIVGYGREGFLIRNSWGESFGVKGYIELPYEDYDSFMEVWTILD